MCYPKSSIWSKPTKPVCWSNSVIWFHGKKLGCLIGRSRSLVIGTWPIFKGFFLLVSPVSLCWCWSISRRFLCLIRAVVLRLRTSIPSGSNSLCWIKGWGSFYFFLFYSVLLCSCLDLWWIVCVVMDQYGLSLILQVFVMILYMYWYCVLFYHDVLINCCQAHHPSGSTPESMTLPNYLPQHG